MKRGALVADRHAPYSARATPTSNSSSTFPSTNGMSHSTYDNDYFCFPPSERAHVAFLRFFSLTVH